jgi:hypothetical protein
MLRHRSKSGVAVLIPASTWCEVPEHPKKEENPAKEVALLLPEKQEKVVFFLPFMAIDFHCESLISG